MGYQCLLCCIGAGMKDLQIIVFGSNASMRMGGEAQKPLRFFDAYRAHGWSPILAVHERNIQEVRERYPDDDMRDVHILNDTKIQIWAFKLSVASQRFFPPLSVLCAIVIWLASQVEFKRALPKIADANKMTVVHVVNPISIFVPLLMLPRSAKIVVGPLALGPGSSLGVESGSNGAALWGKVMLGKLLNTVFPGKRHAAVIFCDGPKAIDIGHRVFGSRPKTHDILHNGVDDRWFDIKREVDPSQKKILYVGRLDKWKGVHHLIDAVKRLEEDVVLEVIGNGPERARLMKLAGAQLDKKIVFLPWLSHDDIKLKYTSSAVFVSPSYAETGGTSVQEAMAAGIPVIATKWGGHIERLPQGCGLPLDPPRKHQEHRFVRDIAEAIEAVLSDPAQAELRAAKARDFAYANFRWKDIAASAITAIEHDVLDLK